MKKKNYTWHIGIYTDATAARYPDSRDGYDYYFLAYIEIEGTIPSERSGRSKKKKRRYTGRSRATLSTIRAHIYAYICIRRVHIYTRIETSITAHTYIYNMVVDRVSMAVDFFPKYSAAAAVYYYAPIARLLSFPAAHCYIVYIYIYIFSRWRFFARRRGFSTL